MRFRRTSLFAVSAVALGGGWLVTPAASAEPAANYEMPFPCGQTWAGTTRSSHSPSVRAVDWNRVDDAYDPVVASAPGVVTVADRVNDSGYGRWVIISHGNGETTLYAHLDSLNVTAGQRVDQGAVIGKVGTTGNSTGTHLHYEQKDGSAVAWPWFNGIQFRFNTSPTSRNCVDVPMAADWNSDDIDQLTVFRRTAAAQFRIYRAGKEPRVVEFGSGNDDPVLGDWDGNGAANVGVRSTSTRTFTLRTPTGETSIKFGDDSARPVSGDWDGNGRWEVGVWNASLARFALRRPDGTVALVKLGSGDDLPVTGDWDGDGITDLGVYDQSTATYTLRKVDQEGIAWLATVRFGAVGDLPVTGDWDGNKRTDLGAWSLDTGTFKQRRAPSATKTTRSVSNVRFGRPR